MKKKIEISELFEFQRRADVSKVSSFFLIQKNDNVSNLLKTKLISGKKFETLRFSCFINYNCKLSD